MGWFVLADQLFSVKTGCVWWKKLLEHSIITAYEKCGWDVDASEHKFEVPIFPSVDDVVVCVKDYIDRSDYSADTKGDYKAAIEKRLQDLCEGMFDKMFNRGSIPFML